MAIQYPVKPGTILLCNYEGFRAPEMVKRRPAVVVSPRLPYRDGLCTVVPLSGTESARLVGYQCRLDLAEPLPDPFEQHVWWIKADMLATVAFHRLDLFRTARDFNGKRRYLHPQVTTDDLERIRACILCAIGIR